MNENNPPKPRPSGKLRRLMGGRVARTAGWLTAWKAVKLANSLIIGIWLARHLGPTDYGVYSYIMALVLGLTPISSFGLSSVVTKDIKLANEEEGRILGATAAMRTFGATVVLLVSVAVATLSSLDTPGLPLMVAAVAIGGMAGVGSFLEYYFVAKQDMSNFVKYSISRIILFSVLKIAFMLVGAGLQALVFVAAVEIASAGLAGFSAYLRHGGRVRDWRVDMVVVRRYWRRSLPLIVSGLSAAIYLKIDIIFLAEMRSASEAGVYAVAARLSEIWFILPPILIAAAFPRLLELRRDQPGAYQRRLQDMFDLMAAAAMMIALTISFVALPLVTFLFGESFAPAAAILVVHVWSCLFTFQRAILGKWFVAEDLYSLALTNNLIGAGANVVLNLLLIPPYGAMGAAVATLISYACATIVALAISHSGRPAARMIVLSLFWPRRLPDLIGLMRGRN